MMHGVQVEGDAQQRGRALGEALRERIHATWQFYRGEVFRNPPFDLRTCGAVYLEAILNGSRSEVPRPIQVPNSPVTRTSKMAPQAEWPKSGSLYDNR